jgi:SAM-dependent methyltransferase
MVKLDARPPIDSISPYGLFARLYDQRWGCRIRDLMLPVLEQLLLRRLPPRARVLDLCCGPARISQALAERGFAVTGLDLDADMLALARANAPACRLLRADARQTRLAPVFAGALSTSDSLNHLLTLPEVASAVANVGQALVPGGIFCFDVLLVDEFQPRERPSQAIVDDEFVQVWRETWDAATARIGGEATLFYRRRGGWQRWDGTDYEQLYTGEEIAGALAGAGFTGIRRLNAAGDLGCAELAGRTFFVAEKGPGPVGDQEPS